VPKSELRVIGIEGLRVADASVMPSIMIGERASDFVKQSASVAWTAQGDSGQ